MHDQPFQEHYPPQPPSPPYDWQQREPAPAAGMQTAAMVCGIVGSVIALVPILGLIGLALGLVAFVLGAIAWKRRAGHPRGVAAAGIILGAVAILLGIVGLVIVNNAIDDLDRDINEINESITTVEGGASTKP